MKSELAVNILHEAHQILVLSEFIALYIDFNNCGDPLNYFPFQPVLHIWCNKSHGMCNPVYGTVLIKYSQLLIRKSSPCSGSSRFSV